MCKDNFIKFDDLNINFSKNNIKGGINKNHVASYRSNTENTYVIIQMSDSDNYTANISLETFEKLLFK